MTTRISAAHCTAITTAGTRCESPPGPNGLCYFHDPGMATIRAEARKRGGRRNRMPHGDTPVPEKISDMAGVLALLVVKQFFPELQVQPM